VEPRTAGHWPDERAEETRAAISTLLNDASTRLGNRAPKDAIGNVALRPELLCNGSKIFVAQLIVIDHTSVAQQNRQVIVAQVHYISAPPASRRRHAPSIR
jgi:hypothetical protein